MRSVVTPEFREAFGRLPASIQRQAREAYRTFAANTSHPGLHLKKVQDDPPIVSVRISRSHRALGVRRGGLTIWFWIGSHADDERRLR